jgi:hypothetical protein
MSLHANKFAEREEKKRGGGGVTWVSVWAVISAGMETIR